MKVNKRLWKGKMVDVEGISTYRANDKTIVASKGENITNIPNITSEGQGAPKLFISLNERTVNKKKEAEILFFGKRNVQEEQTQHEKPYGSFGCIYLSLDDVDNLINELENLKEKWKTLEL